MKKFLLSLATVVVALFTANAATVTFDFANNDYGLDRKSGNASDGYLANGQSITSEDVKLTFNGSGNSWRLWTDGMREYRNSAPKMTVSAPANNVLTKVVFTINSGVKITVSGSSETLTTWTGSVSDVTFDFSTSSGNAAITKMEITYEEGEGGNTGGGDEPVDPNPGGGNATVAFYSTPSYNGSADYTAQIGTGSGTTEISGTSETASKFTAGDITIWIEKKNNSTSQANAGVVRWYQNDIMHIIPANGVTITNIEFAATQGAFTASTGTVSGYKWSGSTNQELTLTTTSQVRFTVMTVTYEGGVTASVSTPTISCTDNLVTIECATQDAKIYYTVNGTEPSSTSNPYTAPFTISENTTIKAIAYVGSDASAVATYTAMYSAPGELTVAQALELLANGYNNTATVKGYITQIDEISTQYGNATYWIADAMGDDKAKWLEVYRGYSLNGEKFSSETEIEVGGVVVVEGTILTYSGTPEFTTGSKIVSYEAPAVSTVATPVISPNGGAVTAGTEVTITCATDGASIYYTVNGDTPSSASNKYANPIVIEENQTIKAIAVKEGMNDSEIASATFSIIDSSTLSGTFDFTTPSSLNPIQDIPEVNKDIDLSEAEFTSNGVSLTISEKYGSTAPRLYNSSGNVDFRLYKEEYFIISVDGQNYHLTSIEFTKAGGNFDMIPANGVGTFNKNGNNATWIPDENVQIENIGFIATGTTRINTITVNYAKGAGITTGVDSIDAEDVAPVYYNLQGVRVDNPEKGLYIVVKGNKASKVIF